MLTGMTNLNMRRRGRWTFFTSVELFVILITLTSGEPVPRCSMQHAYCTISSIAESDCNNPGVSKENSLDLNTQTYLTANMETSLDGTARYLHLSWRYKPKTTDNDTYEIHLWHNDHRDQTCYTLTLNYQGDHGRIILTPQQKPKEQTIYMVLDITEETEPVPINAKDTLKVLFYYDGSEHKTSEILLSGLTSSSRIAFFVKWEGPNSLKMKFIRYADDIEGVTLVITMFYTDYFEDVLSTDTLCLDRTGMMLMKEYGKTLAVHSCVHLVKIEVTTDGNGNKSKLEMFANHDNGIPCPANSSTSTCEKKTTSTAIESTTHTPEGNTSPGLETTVRDVKNTNLGIGTTAPTVRNKEITNLGLTATAVSPHDPKMIAGAVIGGVGGILAIAMLLVLFLYRKGRDFLKLCIDHYRAPDAENPEPIPLPGAAGPPIELPQNPTPVWPRCLIVYVEEEPPDSHHNVMTRDLAEILTSYFNIDIITCKNVEPHAHINQMYEESDHVTLVIIIAYRPTGDLRPGWSITWNKPPRDQPINMATVAADAVVSVTFGCCPTAISHPLNDSNVKPGRHFDIYNNEKSIAALHDFMTENIASPKTSQDRQEFNAKILHMIDNCPNSPGSDCSSNFGTENLFGQIDNINRSFDNL